MVGQKEAVIKLVKDLLPGFRPYNDLALVMLSKQQLEMIKVTIANCITIGDIEYSKDKTNTHEVTTYARAMVMNHLKKAKELNGNVVYGKTVTQAKEAVETKAASKIDMTLLTEDLAEFVKTLV